MDQLPFLLLMLVVFVFFIILPQQRRQKKERNFMSGLKKGDRVITKSGVHGKIAELNDKDNTCVVETLAGKIKMERTAISLELSNKLTTKEKSKPICFQNFFKTNSLAGWFFYFVKTIRCTIDL